MKRDQADAAKALASLNILRGLLGHPPVTEFSLSALSLLSAQVRMLGRLGGFMGSLDATVRRMVDADEIDAANELLHEMERVCVESRTYRSDLLTGGAELRVWRDLPREVFDAEDLIAAHPMPSLIAGMEAVRGRGPCATSELFGQAKFLHVTIHHASGWAVAILPSAQADMERWFVIGPLEWPAWAASLSRRAEPAGASA